MKNAEFGTSQNVFGSAPRALEPSCDEQVFELSVDELGLVGGGDGVAWW